MKEMRKIEIIEKQTIGKNPKKKSEDGIVITDNFIAVIDGSTSKATTRVSRWTSNGRLCMKTIARYIRHAPASITVDEFLRGVTNAVRKKYSKSKLDFYLAHPEERITASCIVFSRLQRQLWIIGDCQCLVGKTNAEGNASEFEYFDNPKPYESVVAKSRADRVRQLLASGEASVESLLNDDIARQSVIPMMLDALKKQNIDYAVIDGFKIPRQKVKVFTFDFEPWTIIMASDGYPILRPTLAESERALAEQREKDPLNIGDNTSAPFIATKAFKSGFSSFDDRSYVKFMI